MKNKIPEIKYSNLKPITYYLVDLEGDKKAFKTLENVGKKVVTKLKEQDYVVIGFNHILSNAKNNKFELNSLKRNNKRK